MKIVGLKRPTLNGMCHSTVQFPALAEWKLKF